MRSGSRIAVALVVVSISAQASAQTAEATADKSLRVGGRVGLNMASVGGDTVDDQAIDMRTGISVGAFATVKLAPNFAVEPGLGYSQKGFKRDGAAAAVDYLEMPILAVGLIPLTPKLALRGFGGPSVGFLLNAEIKGGGQSMDVKDTTKTLDVGAVVGAGADVVLPSGLLLFDARYELGLTSVDDSDGNFDVKNRVFSLNAGYAY